MDTQKLSSTENRMDAIFELRRRKIGYCCTRWGGEIHAVERGYFPCSSTGYRSLSGANEMPTLATLEELAGDEDRENASLLKRCRQTLRNPNAEGRDFILTYGAADSAFSHGFFASPDVRTELWRLAYQLNHRIVVTPHIHPAHPSQGLNRTAWTPDHCEAALRQVIAHRDWLAELLNGTFALPEWSDHRHPFGATSYFRLPPTGPERIIGIPTLEMSLGLDIQADNMTDVDDTRDASADENSGEQADHELAPEVAPTSQNKECRTKHTQDDQLSLF